MKNLFFLLVAMLILSAGCKKCQKCEIQYIDDDGNKATAFPSNECEKSARKKQKLDCEHNAGLSYYQGGSGSFGSNGECVCEYVK